MMQHRHASEFENAEFDSPTRLPLRARIDIIDVSLLEIFKEPRLRASLKDAQKLNLAILGAKVFRAVEAAIHRYVQSGWSGVETLDVHNRLVGGLPGEALFLSASLGFETLREALEFFELTAKTAWHKLNSALSRAQSEQALRLGRIAVMAAEFSGSLEAGKAYLRAPNFSLGGATPLDLLKTSAGGQLVLAELQAQEDGGPV